MLGRCLAGLRRSGCSVLTTLTVVIPTFNRKETLRTTLESCFECSENLPVDYVIVDDGSSDGTADYLRELAQSRENLASISIANSGPGNARNVGAERAAGDIVLFMGDDTRPTSDEFFRTHLRLHERYPEKNLGVLGKIVWPQQAGYKITFVMSLIQGEGGQQFGFADMRPYARYDWRFFYTANVSVKRSCVDDWSVDGFSPDFRLAAFEDGELAYRMSKKLGSFHVLYAPTAVVEHDHFFVAGSFLGRQFAAGMMANVLVEKHPETALKLGLSGLIEAMRKPSDERDTVVEPDYLAVVEGVFASARLVERNQQMGASAWHAPYFNAVFELAFAKGLIWGSPDNRANRAAGYQYALDGFDARIARILEHENLAAIAPLSVVRKQLDRTHQSSGLSFVDKTKRRLRSRLARNQTARRIYHWLKA